MTLFSYKIKLLPLAFTAVMGFQFTMQAFHYFKYPWLAAFAGLGVLIGLYQVLKSREKVTPSHS